MEIQLKMVLFCVQFNYVHFSKRVLLLYGDRTYLTWYLCMCHSVRDRRYQARQHHILILINITSISFNSPAIQLYPMEIYTLHALHYVLGMSMIQFYPMIPSKPYPNFWCRWYYRHLTTAPFQPSSTVWFSLVQHTWEQYTSVSTSLTMKMQKNVYCTETNWTVLLGGKGLTITLCDRMNGWTCWLT